MSKTHHQDAVDYLDDWCETGSQAYQRPYYTIKKTLNGKYRLTIRYDRAQPASFRPLNVTGPTREDVRIMTAMHLKNGGKPWAAI